jgi:hypothetical protein
MPNGFLSQAFFPKIVINNALFTQATILEYMNKGKDEMLSPARKNLHGIWVDQVDWVALSPYKIKTCPRHTSFHYTRIRGGVDSGTYSGLSANFVLLFHVVRLACNIQSFLSTLGFSNTKFQ